MKVDSDKVPHRAAHQQASLWFMFGRSKYSVGQIATPRVKRADATCFAALMSQEGYISTPAGIHHTMDVEDAVAHEIQISKPPSRYRQGEASATDGPSLYPPLSELDATNQQDRRDTTPRS